ncbi:MAG: hypothetical protein AABW88_04245 [Nanoarchaeota archaeon]
MKFIWKVILFLFVFVAVTLVSSQLFSLQILKGNTMLTGSVTSRFFYTPPAEITESSALDALIVTDDDIREVASLGINTFLLNDTLLVAKRYFIGRTSDKLLVTTAESPDKSAYIISLLSIFSSTPNNEIKPQNFSEVMRLTQLISFKKDQAFYIVDRIALAEEKQKKYKKEGVDISEGAALISLARKSLIEERFDEADNLIDDANLKLDQIRLQELRFRSILKGTQSFFQKYWRQSIAIFIILLVTAPFIIPIGKRIYTKRKIWLLKRELDSFKDSLIKIQEDYLKYKTITASSYNIKSESYKTRMDELQKLISVLEAMIEQKREAKKK